MKSKYLKLLRNSCHLIIFICSLSSWYLNLWPEGNALHPFFRFSQEASIWKRVEILKPPSDARLSALIPLQGSETGGSHPLDVRPPPRHHWNWGAVINPQVHEKPPCGVCRELMSPFPGSNNWTCVFAEPFMHSKLLVPKLF